MINDSERREVAARLRGLKEHRDEAPLIFTEQVHNAMVLRAIRAVIGKGDIFQRLADLIDRPTCKNADSHYDVFECSLCHCKVELITEVCNEYGEPFHVPFIPSYCPNCGAEASE